MKFIGVTGGVGAGKSEVLGYLKDKHQAVVCLADQIANELIKPDKECYLSIKEAFLKMDIFEPSGEISKEKFAGVIFSNPMYLEQINQIIHPKVKEFILKQAQLERDRGCSLFVIEAALLIQERYDLICDELWYVDTDEEVRRQRLKDSRGYTDEKITNIIKNQLPREVYGQFCRVIIQNSGSREDTFCQIDRALG